MNSSLKTTLKIFAWFFGILIGLIVLIVILIQIPVIQNILKDKAVAFLEEKIKTPVKIDHFGLGLPKKIVLKGVYFESQEKDTLLAGEELAVDISLFKLLDNKIEINSIDLKGITTNIKRNQDSVFNFDYILDAFIAEQTKEPLPQDTSAAMKFSIEDINLDRIRVRFDDAITKNNLDVYLNHFDTSIKTFNLDSMDFDIPKITLNGLNLQLKQGLVEEIAKNTAIVADSATKSPDLKLKLGEIDLSKINIGYDNTGTKLNSGLTLGKLLVKFNNIDLKNQLIDIDEVMLTDTKGALTFGKLNTKPVVTNVDDNSSTPTPNWKVKLNSADFANIAFRFDDENSPRVRSGIDYMHMNLSNVNLKAENFYYSLDTISGNINQLTAKDKSGLNIQSFKTDFFYGSQSAYLKNLYIKTPQTLIKDELQVRYPSIESLTEDIGELYINASIKGSKLGFKDILIFVPDLANTNPFKSNPNAVMLINSSVIGKVEDLRIPNLEISGIGSTRIAASGRITGLPDMNKAVFDLNIKNFQSTAKDIYQFVPAGTIPVNIQLPASMSAKGTFKGSIDNFSTNMNFLSSMGNAKVIASFDQRRKNRERYVADAVLQNFDVGRLIKNDSIGKISLRAKVNGTGLDPKTANANLIGTVQSAEYNSYTYKNLDLKGSIKSGLFNADASMDDPNLDFNLKAKGSFKGKYPSVKMALNLDSADLGKLNFYAGDLRLRGKVDADIETLDPDYLNGEISLNNLYIAQAADRYLLDSINIISTANSLRNTLDITSQFLTANIDGKYQLTQLATALTNSIAQYYDTSQGIEREAVNPQQFAFKLNVYDDPALLKLVPQLTALEPINMSGRYNSVGDSIILNGTIPRLAFGTNTISNAIINLDTKDNALQYSVIIDEIKNPQILLPHTELTGQLQDNLLDYRLQVRDIEDKERYLIAGNMKAVESTTEFRLELEGLKLNYLPWTIAQDNLLTFGDNGIYANNFLLSNRSQSIRVQSQNTTANSPLVIDFDQFQIETLTSMVEKDSLLVGGTINGNVLLQNLNADPVFTSDLSIKDFNFKADTVGDISLQVNNQQANTFAANVAITGKGNQVNLEGLYKTDNSSFDMDLDIQRLNLKSIQGFTFGNITESSGFLSGDFKITGTATAPNIRGDLLFNEGAFRVAPLNSYFQLLNDRITFNEEGILFNRFSLSDSANNQLVVDGAIYTQTYTDYRFNLNVNADNFRAINSTAKDNELYYGTLFLNTNLRIRGDMNSPVIDGSLKVNEDTKLTIVLPQTDPGLADREGIVEFIDQDNPQYAETFSIPDSLNNSEITGMDVSLNIEVDPKAELTMIIDKGNGDFVQLKGEAELNGGIDPSGKINLTGRYELKEGAYEMSFNFIKRRFTIEEGSSLVWTGEPTTANVDITAVYETETAPINLLDNQLGGVSQAVRNTYKQEIPFQVMLMMDGELLKPEISFDIILPEGNYNVSQDIISGSRTKLDQLRQQPSELNKQVFALLLLNRFIGENPFASEAGSGGVESLARQSVSKILSQQLNDLAGDLIGGVELNFDLEATDDYTTGERQNKTDLNVGLSKRLLNDRLKVTVGSSFGLEGPQQSNQQANNIAGDLSVDYQLSKDGRYLLRAYRQNQYQVAIQGQVVETGVGFILTMDYNKFKEIFERTKNVKRKEEETLDQN